ncbi:hypothetical protein [Natrinema sp. HArc-T2]|uniref:hypothetical protein n=1 Tax=Natrinema sp. HArc-T2 TaxID=3242701 RepID=UPI00359D7C4E
MTDTSSHDDDEDPANADGTELTHDETEALIDETEADPSDRPTPHDDSFDRNDGDELDADQLWAQLETDDPDATETEIPDRSGDREIREVEKGSYCHGCEHFADPPALACTRDGSEILAVPSMTTFRVADCPFVLEDEALERPD